MGRSIMADEKEPIQSVQVFGRKKTATAVAYCKRGKGLIKVNGRPLELVEPRALQFKLQEPILLLGKDRLLILTSVFVSRGAVTPPKCMLLDRLSASLWWLIIRNMLMSKASKRLRTS